MASEYWKWKFKDVRPEEKRELTPEEKRKNWWHYHRWHVVIGIVLVGIAANLVWNALGIGKTEPDYTFAYVGGAALPDDTAAALESAFAALGEDLNGDGQVTVQLRQYVFKTGDMSREAAAAQTALMADILEGDSYFFLLEEPMPFQQNFQVLCQLDGSLPEEGDFSGEGTFYSWRLCPVLQSMELGEYAYDLLGETVTGSSDALVSGLFVARRGYWNEKDCACPEGWAALWDKLTEGAIGVVSVW